MKRKAILCVLVLVMVIPLIGAEELKSLDTASAAEEQLSLTFGLYGNYIYTYDMLDSQGEQKNLFDTSRLRLDYNSPFLDIVIEGTMSNDERYDGADEQEYLYGRYLFMNSGYADLRIGPFTLRTGRSDHSDAVDIPYSLFINSVEHPVLLADIQYQGNLFFLENRWISLNSDSNQYYTAYNPNVPGNVGDTQWVDRGMNYKVYGINAGDWRFGFQDSTIYLDQEFHPEDFFNLFPMYFIQIITYASGRPWGAYDNTKSLMGFFVERERDDSYGAAQILLDDLNGDFIPGVESINLTKMAWSVGGRKEMSFGTIGFYHAGATKYTYEATYARETLAGFTNPPDDSVDVFYSYFPYEYTYYPVSVYVLESGEQMPLHYTENYIGYKYGENNLAFMADYSNSFRGTAIGDFDLYSSLEWIINGAKSPSNPWHEGHDTYVSDKAVEMLGGTLEHVLVSTTRISRPAGGFTLNLDLVLGYRINAAKLEQPATADPEAYIFYPQAGKHEPIVELRLGGSYTWDW